MHVCSWRGGQVSVRYSVREEVVDRLEETGGGLTPVVTAADLLTRVRGGRHLRVLHWVSYLKLSEQGKLHVV